MGLISEDGSMDGHDLRDYAQSNLEKFLHGCPGWAKWKFRCAVCHAYLAKPDKLVDYSLTVEMLIAALKLTMLKSLPVSLAGAPAVEGQRLNTSIIVQSMLKTPEEFAAIPVRINPDGSTVRIRDIGRTELGTDAMILRSSMTENLPPAWPSGKLQAPMHLIQPMQ